MEIKETLLNIFETNEASTFIALGLYILLSGFVITPLGILLYRYFSIKNALIIVALFCVVAIAIHIALLPALGILFSLVTIIKRLFRFQGKKLKRVTIKEKSNNIYLKTKKGTLKIANIFRGVIISGGAGSGKSVSIFYPLISQLIKKDFSGILYDFKSPELSEFAYSIFSDKNTTKFHFLDFKNIHHSVRVNPLSPKYLNKQSIAFELATTLINNFEVSR